jgi:Ca2+-binding EF-hand superfamily protein
MEDPEVSEKPRDFEAIINKIDNSMFRTIESHLKNFKKFDRDADGYVSTNDMKKTLSKMNLINDKEIDLLIKGFDKD